MMKIPIRRQNLAMALGISIIGSLLAWQAMNPGMATAQGSGQQRTAVRPDEDENDLRRDQRFDMDGVLDGLGLRAGMKIADLGAGYGYMTFKLARRVAPGGIVYAEDIDSNALDLLRARAAERGLLNIKTILGTEKEPPLPAGSLDAIFMHAVLQFLGERSAFLRAAARGLKPDGRFVIIEPESADSASDDGIAGPGLFPTRKGYMEIFRRAGLVPVSIEKKLDKKPPKIGSGEKTIFVLKLAVPPPAADLLKLANNCGHSW